MRLLFSSVVMVVFMAASCFAGNFVGSVKTIDGSCRVLRGEQKISVQTGDHVYQGDVLETKSGSMGIIFRDDTILSMGPNSRVAVDSFVFDPAHGNMDFLVNMSKGTAQFITGQMAKISPESMKVETPLSTIGIRGTRFLVKVP